MTAENLAEKYNITRQECDEFALLTQKRWAEGNKIKSNYVELTGQSQQWSLRVPKQQFSKKHDTSRLAHRAFSCDVFKKNKAINLTHIIYEEFLTVYFFTFF